MEQLIEFSMFYTSYMDILANNKQNAYKVKQINIFYTSRNPFRYTCIGQTMLALPSRPGSAVNGEGASGQGHFLLMMI